MRLWLKRIVVWVPVVTIGVAIFLLSHQPGSQLETYMPFFQRWFPFMRSFNWGHFVAYFGLACALSFALGPRYTNLRGRILIIILCTLYGLTDEFHQMYVPDRTADWLDVRNDAIGASLAMCVLSVPAVNAAYLRILRKFH